MTIKILSQNKYLFTDLRHIRCGDLEWASPDGTFLPVINPPGPISQAHANTGFVPHGIRLEAKEGERVILPKSIHTGAWRIVFDDGMYKAFYLQTDPAFICYIESKDGFNWTEPRKSPLEVPPGRVCHEFTWFIDEHGPAEERYKCIYPVWATQSELPGLWKDYQKVHPRYKDLRFSKDRIQRMFAAVSPDGINWTPLPEPLMYFGGDTDTTVYYDNHLGKYVVYTRQFINDRRWIGRAESDDFRNWGPIESIIGPSLESPFSHDLYTNGRCSYPGLDTYHLMFPWIYERYTQRGSVYLYSSEDGIYWDKVPGDPVIPVGETGDWNGEYVGAIRDLVPFGKDKIGMPAIEAGMPHKYPRWEKTKDNLTNYDGGTFWVFWPDGRLCGLVADEDGEFFTFPVVPQGRQLRINARVHRGGDLRVGLMKHGDAGPGTHMQYTYHNRQEIPKHTISDCDPIFGNDLSLPVHWNGQSDIGIREGEAVTPHFKLRAAELFGFEWV